MANKIIAIALVLFSLSCSRENLPVRQKASQLKPGMNRTAVAELFAGYLQNSNPSEARDIEVISGIRVFNTNSPLGANTTYGTTGGAFGLMEACTVWFDTNDVIVAFRYEVMD